MTQSSKKGSKLWLVESSPSDLDSSIISEKMGMALGDFLTSMGLNEQDQSKPNGSRFVWPKHTSREIVDPAEPVFQHDFSDQTWTIRYKALGCYDLPSLITSRPSENLRDSENSPPFRQLKEFTEQSLSDGPKDTLLRRAEPPPSANTITTAQKDQLLSDLQLSETDDESDSELPRPERTISACRSSMVNIPSCGPLVTTPRHRSDVLINVSETLASIPSKPCLISPLPAEPLSITTSPSSVDLLRHYSRDHSYKNGTKYAKPSDTFHQQPNEKYNRFQITSQEQASSKPVSISAEAAASKKPKARVGIPQQAANLCSPLSILADVPPPPQQLPLSSDIGQRLSNQTNFDENGQHVSNVILPTLPTENRSKERQAFIRQVLERADAYWYPLQMLTDASSTDDYEEGGELDAFSKPNLDDRLQQKKYVPPIRRKFVFGKVVSPLPSEPICNGVASPKTSPILKNNIQPKNRGEKNGNSSSAQSSLHYSTALIATKRTHSSGKASTPYRETSASRKLVKEKRDSAPEKYEQVPPRDASMPPPDTNRKRKRSRWSSSTTEESPPTSLTLINEKSVPIAKPIQQMQAPTPSELLASASTRQYLRPPLRVIPPVPWVLSSLAANDTRALIPKVIAHLSNQTLLADKLVSLRFILTNLRVTGNVAVERPLTGVLILPEPLSLQLSPKPEKLTKFCEMASCTTPRPTSTDHGVQYDVAKKAQCSTQMSPLCHVSMATNTSPLLGQVSVCTGTSFSPLRFGNMEQYSVLECLQKVLNQNDDVAKRCKQSFDNSSLEQQCNTACQLRDEANACWKKLVTYITSTSSQDGKERMKQFVCSCGNPEAILHFLFNNQEFAIYPEKLLTSTRHLLIAAHLAESSAAALAFYDQITTTLNQAIHRLHRLESKLIRRACTATRSQPISSSRPRMDDIGAREWSDLWYSVLARIVSIVRYKMWQLVLPREEQIRKKIEEDEFLKGLEFDRYMGDSPLSPSNDAAQAAESLNTDSMSSGMCSLPISTVARLIKLTKLTSMAQESLQYREQSEEVVSTNRYASFGGVAPDSVDDSLSRDNLSSPTNDKATAMVSDTDRLIPVFPAPTGDIGSIIAYLDGVLQHHKRLLARLGTCPSVGNTKGHSRVRTPSLHTPAIVPSSQVVKSRLSISPQATVKRKFESQVPAFEDLLIRPCPFESKPIKVNKKKKRQISQVSTDDTDISTAREDDTKEFKKLKSVMPVERPNSSVIDETGASFRKTHQKPRPQQTQSSSTSFTKKNGSARIEKQSHGKSATLEPRLSPQAEVNFENSEVEPNPNCDQKKATRRRPLLKKSNELLFCEKSMTRPVYHKFPISPPPIANNRSNSNNRHKAPDSVQNGEAYSPTDTKNRLSYSPTRPETSSENSTYRASKITSEQQYIPSVPRPEPSTNNRRSLLAEPSQSTTTMAGTVPAFFYKWMDTGSSVSSSNASSRGKSSSSFRPKPTPLPPSHR